MLRDYTIIEQIEMIMCTHLGFHVSTHIQVVFQSIDFKVIEEVKTPEWPLEPPKRAPEIELNRLYVAKLMWTWETSKDRCDKEYYVISEDRAVM
ncbi:hypothetical protein [Domibacillus aminovorans]|uniref:Uncharacterized protein n=1 Tax=Domibacillus aminovorans TaxID=29332 RepID=A0A177L6F6_9BACI|nr:hypothetical protein [Domibacillus aminovorans]OAH60927.1 hypothetical protein AWH49_14660 [Domibacillus aminovorans]